MPRSRKGGGGLGPDTPSLEKFKLFKSQSDITKDIDWTPTGKKELSNRSSLKKIWIRAYKYKLMYV